MRITPQRQYFAIIAVMSIAAAFALALTACNPGGIGQEQIEVTYTVDPAADEREPSAAARTVERDLRVVTVTGKDSIPAIRSPEFVSADDAESWMEPDEPVIGIEIDGDARAYPTAMLSRHEIVNDTVGGASIAVTW